MAIRKNIIYLTLYINNMILRAQGNIVYLTRTCCLFVCFFLFFFIFLGGIYYHVYTGLCWNKRGYLIYKIFEVININIQKLSINYIFKIKQSIIFICIFILYISVRPEDPGYSGNYILVTS